MGTLLARVLDFYQNFTSTAVIKRNDVTHIYSHMVLLTWFEENKMMPLSATNNYREKKAFGLQRLFCSFMASKSSMSMVV